MANASSCIYTYPSLALSLNLGRYKALTENPKMSDCNIVLSYKRLIISFKLSKLEPSLDVHPTLGIIILCLVE